eukprot:scaffold300_cov258-Pinguiococcus_pyrenoidosus.AAC.56
MAAGHRKHRQEVVHLRTERRTQARRSQTGAARSFLSGLAEKQIAGTQLPRGRHVGRRVQRLRRHDEHVAQQSLPHAGVGVRVQLAVLSQDALGRVQQISRRSQLAALQIHHRERHKGREHVALDERLMRTAMAFVARAGALAGVRARRAARQAAGARLPPAPRGRRHAPAHGGLELRQLRLPERLDAVAGSLLGELGGVAHGQQRRAGTAQRCTGRQETRAVACQVRGGAGADVLGVAQLRQCHGHHVLSATAVARARGSLALRALVLGGVHGCRVRREALVQQQRKGVFHRAGMRAHEERFSRRDGRGQHVRGATRHQRHVLVTPGQRSQQAQHSRECVQRRLVLPRRIHHKHRLLHEQGVQ